MKVNKSKIRKGIEAYKHQQDVLIRLIRKQGPRGLSSHVFDTLFHGRELARSYKLRSSVSGDSYLLGLGQIGASAWSENLELLQIMCSLGDVAVHIDDNNEAVYTLP